MNEIGKYFRKRIAAFGYAFKGIGDLLRNHPHAHIHALATLVVLGFSCWLPLARWEWVAILICIGIVWAAEAFNTAIEYLTDLTSPDYHPLAGKAKDMASGAVLLACIFAAIAGFLIFFPHLQQYFGHS